MSVSAASRGGRRALPLETSVEQSQLDDILNDLLTDPLFAGGGGAPRSFEWSNDADGTYGSISPKHGSITTHSGHGGRTVVSWQVNQHAPTGDRPVVAKDAAATRVQSTASARPAAAAAGPGGRYESRRLVETRSETTSTRRETAGGKPQPPTPPVRRRLFSPDSFDHVDGPVVHSQQRAGRPRGGATSDGEEPVTFRSRWVDEQQQRSTSATRTQTSRQQQQQQQRSTWRAGPTTVVHSDTEDYFRPSRATERRAAPPSVPQRWHSTAADDPYLSDSGLLSSRRGRPAQPGRSLSATRTYDLESGRLFETKRSFFVSGLERPPARRGPDTKYTFSVSPQRSLPADEFPTKTSRAPPTRSSLSPVLPPLRTESSREAVTRINTTSITTNTGKYTPILSLWVAR